MTTTQYDAEVKRITDAGGQWPPKTDDTPDHAVAWGRGGTSLCRVGAVGAACWSS